MPPKKKNMWKKKKSKRVGEYGGGGVGGSSLPTDLYSMIAEEDLLQPLPAGHRHAPVVYVERVLTKAEWCCPNDPIREGWLERCMQDSHKEWYHRLPKSLQPTDLNGRLVPEDTKTFQEITSGKGLVVVELAFNHTDYGFVNQFAEANATVLSKEESFKLEMAKMKAEMKAESKAEMAVFNMKMANVLEELTSVWERRDKEHALKLLALKVQVQEHEELLSFMRKELVLSNKIKLRVALTLARGAVEHAVGRTKPFSETWSCFISGFSTADWTTAGVSKKKVMDLLADGAYDLNNSIHSIPASEVVEAIDAMRIGPLRSAWEDIFFLAFRVHVVDLIFPEEA